MEDQSQSKRSKKKVCHLHPLLPSDPHNQMPLSLDLQQLIAGNATLTDRLVAIQEQELLGDVSLL
jgi:hypothetical protein